MLKKISRGLAILALVLAAVYGLALYLTRLDFEPVPLAGSSGPLRLGEVIMDVPRPLEIGRYEVTLQMGDDSLYLSESPDGSPPPYDDSFSVWEASSEDAERRRPVTLVTFDVSADLGRKAALEVIAWKGQESGVIEDFGLRALIPLESGFLAFDKRLDVPPREGSREEEEQTWFDGIVRDRWAVMADQVKTVLPHYQWLGPEVAEKPQGFMTRYGLLDPAGNGFKIFSSATLTYTSDTPETFSFHISTWPRTSAASVKLAEPSTPFLWEMEMLASAFTGTPTRFHNQFRQAGGKPGHEMVIYTYERGGGYFNLLAMEWADQAEPGGGSGDFRLSLSFLADNFERGKEAELFSLWRHLLDSAR